MPRLGAQGRVSTNGSAMLRENPRRHDFAGVNAWALRVLATMRNDVSTGDFYDPEAVTAAARAKGALREGEAMPQWPTADGRVKLAAGWLIERAGVKKGWTVDGAGVSHRHALALVNRGGTTRSLLAMAERVRARVREAFGVTLEIEPERVG